MNHSRITAEIAVWFLLLCGGSWADDVPPVAPDLPVADVAIADVSGRVATGARPDAAGQHCFPGASW